MRSKPASPRPAEAAPREPLGPWVWLFPATYLFHIAEELWGGEGFPEWVSRFAAVTLTREEFLRINVGFWVAMTAAVFIVRRAASADWIVATLATLVTVNGFLHLAGSAVTGTYSPGLVTGVLLWVPLGIFALKSLRARLGLGTFWPACLGGLGLQAMASLGLLGIGR